MPLARYQIRNEYSLADPELYRAADKDDPEALLEGVAMAGLVGVLRQLGDLSQFAAEIFHDLHEEVMATAARGHGLMARVQQLEAEVPSLEKALLSQTHHSSFFFNGGSDWHPNLRSEQNLITREDLPRFVMESYEDCRGPPRLFLLDKFDVAGAGACLKRYTDPSFFKLESASSETATAEIHWEKRSRRVKKKAARLRNGETPEVVPTHAKLHQLLLEERIENAYSNPARLVKLKKRQLNGSGLEAKTGKSYMDKFLESPSPDYKMVCETSVIPLSVKSMSEDASEGGIKILEISTVSPVKRSSGNESARSSPNKQESELKSSSEMEMETKEDLVKVHEQMPASVTSELSYNNMKAPDETELADDGLKKLETCLDGYHSDDAASEADNYMDALTTMESEMETDHECRPKKSFLNSQMSTDSDGKEEHQLQAQLSHSQSFGGLSTSDESSSFKQVRNDECNELPAGLSGSQSIGTASTLEENGSFKREISEDHMEQQAQFSDSQSVGNSSASEEISVNKKDTSCFSHSGSLGVNKKDSQSIGTASTLEEYGSFRKEISEDHMELQTQFSDSHSVGDSSASEEINVNKKDTSCFSHSGSLGVMVENIKSEPLLLSSTKCCEYENEDTPSNHLPEFVELQKPDCNKLVMHDNAESQEADISNSKQGSNSCWTNGHIISMSDLGANSPVIQSTETQLVETTSDTVEIHSNLADKDRKCLVEPTPVVPDALSIVEDDACPVSSSEKYTSNNLDDGDPYVQSGALIQISNDLKLAPVIVPKGTQLVERPSDPVELHSSLADDEERKCHVESVAAVPDALSILKDDVCPVVSSKNDPVNNLDDGDPYVHSDASLQISNDLELAPVVIPTRNQLVETPSEPVELHSSLVDDEERKCHVESIAMAPSALSITKDDACSVVSSKEHPLNNLDYGDPYVHSKVSVQISKDLNLAPVDECRDHSEIKVLQAGISNDNSVEILAGGEVSSPGEHPIFPFMEEVGATLPLDGTGVLDSKTEDCVIAGKLNSEDLSPAVETLPASGMAYFSHESLKDEPDLGGVQVLYSDRLSNFEELSRVEHSDEKIGSTCSMDAVEDGHLQQPSSPGYVGQGNHMNVNDVFTEKIQSEDRAASAAPVDSAESGASIAACSASSLISSSSRNLANLQEPFPGSSDLYQSEMESNKAGSTKIFRDLNAETRKDQLEPSSDIIASNVGSSSMRDPTNMKESLSSFRDPHANEMEINAAVARESSTELEAQKVVVQPEVGSADVGLSLDRSVSYDLSDLETSNSIQDSSLKVKSQYISSVNDANDVTVLPEHSELGTRELESSSCKNNSLPSPSYNQLELKTLSELQSQAGQQDADFPVRAEENSVSQEFQSEQMQVSNQLEQERKSLAASESSPELCLEQLSSFESLSQSAGQEMNATKHVMDSLKPLPDPFPLASEINLGEMPPMPPLPPMQWRKGKVQHASQEMKTDEKGQFGLLSSERETLQYQNPFLPVVAVEGDKIQYSSGFSVGVSGHPVAVPLQFPFMVNEANGQYNYLVLERSQIQNPFLTLPVVSTGRPPHGYSVASEGEMVQYSNLCPPMPPVECAVSGLDPVSSHEKVTQPPNQLMSETTSEVKELKHSLGNLEREQEDPSATPTPPPSKEIVQHNHSLPPSEGKMESSLDISAPTSEIDGEKPNGISKSKLPRPRNPLIDAVAAHDKSKMRKVTERAGPETAPKIDERDSLLEQIRTKSFNLKPAVATRPSTQGPKTNLKVAAILEKANAIRQALAGSDDEDDDADNWSDS